METSAALLILIAAIAIGVTSAVLLGKRHRATWRSITQRDDHAYRAGSDERAGMPLRVRVAIAMSYLMAAMCAVRVAASIDDITNLADGPHIRLNLVPSGMHTTIIAAILMGHKKSKPLPSSDAREDSVALIGTSHAARLARFSVVSMRQCH
jgi:hypothetical protein